MILVSWTQDAEGLIELDITVPDGVAASVKLPGADEQELGSGKHILLNLRSLNPECDEVTPNTQFALKRLTE